MVLQKQIQKQNEEFGCNCNNNPYKESEIPLFSDEKQIGFEEINTMLVISMFKMLPKILLTLYLSLNFIMPM